MAIKTLAPLTRIEGHLAVKTEIRDGRVVDVWVKGEMYRGFENILSGRRPFDALRITQRICGVCHEVHGIASARALADLYKIELPPNGALLQDILLAIHMASDHVLHFYHLAVPDYVDFAAILAYRGQDPELKGLKEWVKNKGPYLFTRKVPGDYLQDPSRALPFLVHYLEALEVVVTGAKALAILGGKAPFAHTVFPGGLTIELTPDRLAKVADLVDRLRRFTFTTYLPDVMSLARLYPAYFKIGRGYQNLISYGGFASLGRPLFSPGVLIEGQRYPFELTKITEHVAYSYYEGSSLPFSQGVTRPIPNKGGAYSWIKAPRYDGHPMETGPLSRIYLTPEGQSRLLARLKNLGQGPDAAFSTMGRHLARATEAEMLFEFLPQALEALDLEGPTIRMVNPEAPVSGQGVGLSNAARGELLHYVEASSGRIVRYQCVVPSTWNFSPRDEQGRLGPAEKAILGTPVAYKEGLIEVGRVIRSFDPCLACSIH
ncbi:nickel-dependent hydrogenase large subunit [Thermosulfuriphilus sp.]